MQDVVAGIALVICGLAGARLGRAARIRIVGIADHMGTFAGLLCGVGNFALVLAVTCGIASMANRRIAAVRVAGDLPLHGWAVFALAYFIFANMVRARGERPWRERATVRSARAGPRTVVPSHAQLRRSMQVGALLLHVANALTIWSGGRHSAPQWRQWALAESAGLFAGIVAASARSRWSWLDRHPFVAAGITWLPGILLLRGRPHGAGLMFEYALGVVVTVAFADVLPRRAFGQAARAAERGAP